MMSYSIVQDKANGKGRKGKMASCWTEPVMSMTDAQLSVSSWKLSARGEL